MQIRTIELSPTQAKRIDTHIKKGIYGSEQELLDAALKLADTKEKRADAKMTTLMAAAQVGIDDIEAGRFEVFHTPEALEARILEIWDEAIAEVKAAVKAA